jgi:hypothetical protein
MYIYVPYQLVSLHQGLQHKALYGCNMTQYTGATDVTLCAALRHLLLALLLVAIVNAQHQHCTSALTPACVRLPVSSR